ncbi:MAG: metallophosphoesterase family protein, partial [Methanopyri archaeon]|nr:metallophosphoesterase family protein [Methanopyri archaeon]
MLVGLVADIHGNIHALEAVLADLRCDEVWCLGDIVGYGAVPEEVVDRVRDEGIRCIKGNHDD